MRWAARVETIAKGLESPWEIAFLPDGRTIVPGACGYWSAT
jgi:glucose/arabinose dehydrogenase